MDGFGNYIVKKEHFKNQIKDQLQWNAIMIDLLSDLMFKNANDVNDLGKHASMVHTQLEQVANTKMICLLKWMIIGMIMFLE